MPPIQTIATGFVVAVVGFFGSFPILLQGLVGVGATSSEAASGLMAAAIAMGLTAIVLSLWSREPASVAWSTPGAALLAATAIPVGGFSGAIAGFLFAGALTVLAGLIRPLGRLMTRIPGALAQAMLAGVLVWLCVAPFKALAEVPLTALPIVLTWFVVGRFSRMFAVPAAVVAAFVVTLVSNGFHLPLSGAVFIAPELTAPQFSLATLLGIGLPLFIVTMATQNVPGIAVLRSYGYSPKPGPLLVGVGGASVLSAPFGAPATCLAAITASMCSNEDSHPDPGQRYWSAVMAGAFYCLFGLFAAVITTIATLAPPMTIETLAGVALLGVFANSAHAALEQPDYREAAAVTFLTTLSGITLFGLGAAVWGLVLGGIVQFVASKLRR